MTTNQSLPPNNPIQITLPVSTKLDKTNFLTWQSQITPILNGFELMGYLDGSITTPPPTITAADGKITSNPTYLPWHRQDQLLLGWLRSSILEPILAQFVNCQTSHDLWVALNQTYSTSSRARKLELRRQLQTTTKGGMSCSEYFQQMKLISDHLASIGSPVTDDDLTLYILNGLGPNFNSFVVAVNTNIRHEPLSLTDLHGLLLTHETRLELQNTTQPSLSASDPMAYASTYNTFPTSSTRGPLRPTPASGSHNSSHPFSIPPTNSNHGRPTYPPLLPTPTYTNSRGRGHNHRGCGRGNSSNNRADRPQCQICGKFGHVALKCYHRFDYSYTS